MVNKRRARVRTARRTEAPGDAMVALTGGDDRDKSKSYNISCLGSAMVPYIPFTTIYMYFKLAFLIITGKILFIFRDTRNNFECHSHRGKAQKSISFNMVNGLRLFVKTNF